MKFTLSGTLLLLLVGAGFWLTLGQGESLPSVTSAPSGQITESYLIKAERWSYDPEGYRNHVVRLSEGTRYSDNPITYLTGLTFHGPDRSGRFWTVTAGSGMLKSQANELQLSQGVEIRDSAGEGRLTTPRLRILIDEEKALNRAPVELQLRDSLTTARGLELDLKSGVAKLLSDVETNYES